MTGTRRLTVSRLSLATGYPNRTEKCTSQDHLTAGGASWGSKLAPCSFYLVPVTREVTTTKPKNHLHKLLYKTTQGENHAIFLILLRHLPSKSPFTPGSNVNSNRRCVTSPPLGVGL